MGSGEAGTLPPREVEDCRSTVLLFAEGFVAGATKTPRQPIISGEYVDLPPSPLGGCRVAVAPNDTHVELEAGARPCRSREVFYVNVPTTPTELPLPDVMERIGCPP